MATRVVDLILTVSPLVDAFSALEVGEERTPPGHNFPPRNISSLAFIYTVEGTETVRTTWSIPSALVNPC